LDGICLEKRSRKKSNVRPPSNTWTGHAASPEVRIPMCHCKAGLQFDTTGQEG